MFCNIMQSAHRSDGVAQPAKRKQGGTLQIWGRSRIPQQNRVSCSTGQRLIATALLEEVPIGLKSGRTGNRA